MVVSLLRQALAPFALRPLTTAAPRFTLPMTLPIAVRAFSTTVPQQTPTLMQVIRGCRKPRRARHKVSPALHEAKTPMLKGVCLKVGVTRPKKPNSGERKTARVRLSTGRVVTAFIPGEGHNIQQHSVVLVKGGRLQDCPGVRYKMVRGALDLVSALPKTQTITG
jgi:small subunit ribosomal protein S12